MTAQPKIAETIRGLLLDMHRIYMAWEFERLVENFYFPLIFVQDRETKILASVEDLLPIIQVARMGLDRAGVVRAHRDVTSINKLSETIWLANTVDGNLDQEGNLLRSSRISFAVCTELGHPIVITVIIDQHITTKAEFDRAALTGEVGGLEERLKEIRKKKDHP